MISVVYRPRRRGPAVLPIVLFERESDKFAIWARSAIRPADATMEQLVELFDQARLRQEYRWNGPACEDVRR